MFIISFFRAIKFSIQDIFRNFWLSLVTVVILVLALFLINVLLSVQIITKSAINSIKEKIDINLYVKSDAPENEIIALKTEISNFDKVKDAAYISKAEALESFKDSHRNNPEILQALRELNKNPLNATIIIKPKNIEQYEELTNELDQINNDIIESKNFDNPKTMLAKINAITGKINEVGLVVSLIFVLVTILVVYNSIRVTIYTHQREIKVMRLVGATNWFIRAPFLISSVFYTLIGLSITMAIFYPFLTILQPYLEAFFAGYNFNILSYFNKNFLLIFGAEFIVAVAINMIASLIAVRKYTKI
ncbi:MAG: Cell division protein ftsX [Parcubacteria group bacterium GW2011_GWE2_38_18]|nr:MAG: Cell division protein ftsX [Parcubacteria group bacterium GW2011_GWE2_38_18]